jgi:hypothetical protein
MDKKFLAALTKKSSIDEKNYTIDFVMTIEVQDRHGDMVDVDSIKTEEFMKNPVFLPAHDHNAKPIGKIIALEYEVIDGKKALVGRVKFAVEEYDLAKTYWNLYKGGYMSAVSMGFIPESGEMRGDTFLLMGANILELSAVSIPANQLALAKAKGIDVQPVIAMMDFPTQAKEMRETLITFKELFDVEKAVNVVVPTETDTPTEPPTEDKKADRSKIARERLFKNVNQAIRELKKV